MALRRSFATVVAMSGALALSAPALAATETAPGSVPSNLTKVNLLTLNDFHGHIDDNGVALACLVEQRRAALGVDSTLLLAAGDSIGASPFTSASAHDVPTMEYLNALGLTASSLGNHEFDHGLDNLFGLVKQTEKFPLLGANVYKKGTQTPAFPEYTIKTVNGVRVGVIGAVTANTPNITMPTNVADVTIGDPVAAVNRVAAHLKAEGLADVIVAEYHAGGELAAPATLAENEATSAEFTEVVNKTSADVDVLATGHSHQAYTYAAPAADGTRPLIQSGNFGKYLGQIELGIDPTTKKVVSYSLQNLPTKGLDTSSCASNPTVAKVRTLIDDAKSKAAAIGNVVVGTQTGDLPEGDGESVLGNLDAQAWLDEMNMAGRPGADIGVMNAGGVRTDLLFKASGTEKDGEITYGEAMAVNPFNNTLQVVTLTGAQLKTLLEQQWTTRTGDQIVPVLGLSQNVRYTYDPTKPVNERITSITVNGKSVAASDTFKVASNSFLMTGGDGYTVLKDGANRVDTGLLDGESFVEWVKAHTPITPDTSARGTAGSGTATATPTNSSTSSPTSAPTSSSTSSPVTSPTTLPSPSSSSTTSTTGSASTTSTAAPTSASSTAAPTSGASSTSTGSSTSGNATGTQAPSSAPVTSGSSSSTTSTGPKVDTDQVSSGSFSPAVPAVIVMLLAGAGGLVARRRRGQQH